MESLYPEAEFLDVIARKVLFTVTSTNPSSGLKLVCYGNIVYGDLKSKNYQDYAQKPQRNCTFMN